MTALDLEIPATIPTRNAVAALRHHIVEQIVRRKPAVGTSLMSAEAMAEHFGVSRSTMNRVLEGLQREGWIERRVGQGTFVGHRVELTTMVPVRPMIGGKLTRVVRLAVAVLPLEQSIHNWHAQGLLNGIDAAASDGDVSVELFGDCNNDNNKFARRLAQTQPDVLALLKPWIHSAPILREAERLNIPCLMTGTRLRDIPVPAVYEDGLEAVRSAVRYLVERGHTRIGFMVPNVPDHLWFDRRRGYEAGMADAGIEMDQNLIHWCEYPAVEDTPRLQRYLNKMRPTAVILAEGQYIAAFAPIIRSGQLRVPQDLSIIPFDQCFDFYRPVLGDALPTYIELPVRQMSEWIIEQAKHLAVGHTVPMRTVLPCRIIEGQSTAPLRK